MLYALLIGMALFDVSSTPSFQPGIAFAGRTVLRVGVALLGARITLHQLTGLGLTNGALVVASVALTILAGIVISRWLGLSRRIGVLTGGATAICGASAAIAIASVLPKGENSERELIFTVAGVTALSTLAMVIYPLIVHLLGMQHADAGLFLGGTIHDVAQVVGAGYSISPEVGDAAVLTKMLRVALLLPVVMVITLVVRHRFAVDGPPSDAPLLPGFLVAFIVLVGVSSAGWLPNAVVAPISDLSRGCLVTAIAAVGLKTSVAEIKRVGSRAMLLLVAETVFLAVFILATQLI